MRLSLAYILALALSVLPALAAAGTGANNGSLDAKSTAASETKTSPETTAKSEAGAKPAKSGLDLEVEELREQLIGIVGHDLRGPLSSVLVGAQTMLRRGTLSEADAKATARISTSADRMAKIIAALLDFTRARLGGGISIDPRPMVHARYPLHDVKAAFAHAERPGVLKVLLVP